MADESQETSPPPTSAAPDDLSVLNGYAPNGLVPPAPAAGSPDETGQFPAPALARCPRCGAETDTRLNRCTECGYRFTVRCPECGAVNSGEASACVKCGHRLISTAYGAWTVGPAAPRARARRRARATKRIGSRTKPEGRSPLFYVMVVTGLVALALAILIIALLVVPDFL
jgi:hypothetical protein